MKLSGVIDCCLMQKEQFFSYYIKVRTNNIPWDDDDVSFVLDKHYQAHWNNSTHYPDCEPTSLCSYS